MSGLGAPGVAAVKWSTVSTAGRFVLQLVAQVVLARTLGPEIFGIFAIGMVVLTFAAFVSGFGFSWSLLQRVDLHDDDIRFAWTWQVIVGIVTMLTLYMTAPLLATYFRESRAQAVIEWLSLACLLTAAAAPATYLLQRDLNFKAVGLIQVVSYAVGYVLIGVPMALTGWGTASLVAAWLVQATVQLAASYALKPHTIRPLFWYAGASSAFGTGRAVFLTNIVNWTLNNMDRIMIGRLLNAQALGLYNLAYNLATTPNTLLNALQPAFLAAGAQLQDQQQRLGRVYLQMIATIMVLATPVFVFLALVSPDLVQLLYGPKWSDAGWVLSILFLSIPAYMVWGLSTPVLWNTGRKHYEFALQLPLVAAGALLFYFFAARGIRTAAAIAAMLLVLRALVIGIAACRALNLPVMVFLPHLFRGLLLSLVCVAGVAGGQHLTGTLHMPVISLTVMTLITSVTAGALIAIRPQILGCQTSKMVIRFFPRLSSLLQKADSSVSTETLREQRS